MRITSARFFGRPTICFRCFQGQTPEPFQVPGDARGAQAGRFDSRAVEACKLASMQPENARRAADTYHCTRSRCSHRPGRFSLRLRPRSTILKPRPHFLARRKSLSHWRQAASSAGLGGSLQGMVSNSRTEPSGKLWRNCVLPVAPENELGAAAADVQEQQGRLARAAGRWSLPESPSPPPARRR